MASYTTPARLHRVWRVAEEIAANPGQQRVELARTFCLSERHIQSDINLIRHTMGLPLIRQQGYRFAGEGPSVASGLTLQEAQVLLVIFSRARQDPAVSTEQLLAIRDRLVLLFPIHLQAIVSATMAVLDANRPTPLQAVLLAVLQALLRGAWVKLMRPGTDNDLVIRPDVLLPFFGGWYVLGEEHRHHRFVGCRLADVTAVAPMVVTQEIVQRVREVAS